MDLTEAEDIKKRGQEYTEELYKQDLHDPDNHNGVITYLEQDILECVSMFAGLPAGQELLMVHFGPCMSFFKTG